MKERLFYIISGLILVGCTGANAYYMQAAYRQYMEPSNRSIVTLAKQSDVANAKERAVSSGEQGEKFSEGSYTYTELDKSRIDSSDNAGQLVVASNNDERINYLLAFRSSSELTTSNINPGWVLHTLSTDPMWSPGACASKPTYFLQGKYIFIDDGRTKPTDKYNSYVVFDLLTQKFRYFGGDDFTDQQATKEKILAAVDQDDQIVFYIDPADDKGPLASSTSFKHARGYSASYIIRRVIDPLTLKYVDYKLPYTVPADGDFNFYYVSYGSSADELITLDSDTTDTYYSGKVSNNAISLSSQSLTVQSSDSGQTVGVSLDQKLSPALDKLLPDFVKHDASTQYSSDGPDFGVTEIGSHGATKYLVATSNVNPYGTPVIYDADTNTLTPLTTQAILGWNDYVPLGVF